MEMTLKTALEEFNRIGENLFDPNNVDAAAKLSRYINHLDEIGADYLSRRDSKETLDMLYMIQSAAFTALVLEGEDISRMMILHSNPLVAKYCALIMKYTIALSIEEEMR